MNRDFEIKQLLRAYRKGILSEAAFSEEMQRLEQGSLPEERDEGGFRAFGRLYRSERDAVVSFLDELRAARAQAAVGFAKWSGICQTDGLRTGLAIVAEREAYQARIFGRRVQELGGELRAVGNEQSVKLAELLARSDLPDAEKLAFVASLSREPKEAVRPILEFASLLSQDSETRQALRLAAEDEFSSTGWLHEMNAALTAASNGASKP
jgi:signal transduction histidine kinase